MSTYRYIASGFVLLLAWGCTQSAPAPTEQPSPPKPQAQIDGPFTFVDTPAKQPQWAVRYGKEFWRTKNSDFKQSAIARVRSAFEPDLKTQAATVKGQSYNAKLTQQGLNLTLRTDRPKDRKSRHKHIETSLSSATMQCGQQAKGSSKGNWSIAGNTAQRKMAMATEHIHTMPKHVEMSWIFQQQPCDNLIVSVHVGQDLRASRRTDTGIHFADARGMDRLRVSYAVLVDAKGQRRAVKTTGEGANLKMHLSAKDWQKMTFPVALDPVFTPEFGTDAPVFSSNVKFVTQATIATNGSTSLVVWNEEFQVLRALRLDATGTPIDMRSLLLTDDAHRREYPAVASNGTDFLVVWEDDRNGNEDIYGTRIQASNGQITDGFNGIKIVQLPEDQARPSIQWGQGRYLLVWEDDRSGFFEDDIYGAYISHANPGGQNTPFAISAAPERQQQPKVSIDAQGNAFVTWIDGRPPNTRESIYGARVNANGVVQDAAGIAIDTTVNFKYDLTAHSNGTTHAIAWENSGDNNIYTAVVNATGTVSNQFTITQPSFADHPSITDDGSNYFVAWERGNQIYGTRLSSQGVSLDASPIRMTNLPDVRSNVVSVRVGNQYLFVWEDERMSTSSGDNLYSMRTNFSGTAINPQGVPLLTSPNEQRASAIASNGNGYFLVWEDSRTPPDDDLFGIRLNAQGTPIDMTAIKISSAVSDKEDPAVASDGTNYFVVWVDNRLAANDQIFGTRVRASTGQVLDTQDIVIANVNGFTQGLKVAAAGTSYAVVWENNSDIFLGRVRNSGSLSTPLTGINLTNHPGVQEYPAIASNGTGFLVAWEDDRISGDSFNPDVFGTRLDASGNVLDPQGIAISTATDEQDYIDVASNGTDYFVVWQDERNGTEDIYGARVGANGSVLDPQGIAVSSAPRGQFDPAVTANGDNYIIAWEDDRNGSGSFNFSGEEVYATRLETSTGTIVDGVATGFFVARGEQVDIASSALDSFVVTYQGERQSTELVQRVLGRQGAFDEDNDTITDSVDNCPTISNTNQADADGDGVGDVCDNCPQIANSTQDTSNLCVIGNQCYPAGTPNPSNNCQSCIPTQSNSAWSNDDNNSCDDGLFCTENDRCQAGSCVGTSKQCPASANSCEQSLCDDINDRCVNIPKQNNTPCDDGQFCTITDSCQNGTCTGSARDCSGQDNECNTGVCNEGTDACEPSPKPQGTACGDTLSCSAAVVTLPDQCDANGACADGGTMDCAPYVTCADATSCPTTCSANTDCINGYVCANNACRTNTAPVADAGMAQTVNENTTVTLDGRGSSDADGDALTYTWTQTAGPTVNLQNPNTATPTLTAPNQNLPLVLTYELIVNDGFVDSAPATVNVNVQMTPNRPPVADAGMDQTVTAGDTVTLDASGSSDPDNDPITVRWQQERGPSVVLSEISALQPTFIAPDVQQTTEVAFSLIARDGMASSTPDEVVITIEPRMMDMDMGMNDMSEDMAGDMSNDMNTTDMSADMQQDMTGEDMSNDMAQDMNNPTDMSQDMKVDMATDMNTTDMSNDMATADMKQDMSGPTNKPKGEDEGCGCRTVNTPQPRTPYLLLLVAFGALMFRRRKTRR